MTLPGGFDALLGKEFEGGTDLSEGQWQKVAISRALMDRTPLVLILDEPTSGLDADAEHALFEHYASAASRAGSDTSAVTVLISHRFSTVRLADLIVVVDGGRVREHGSHDELMAAAGSTPSCTASRRRRTAEHVRASRRGPEPQSVRRRTARVPRPGSRIRRVDESQTREAGWDSTGST